MGVERPPGAGSGSIPGRWTRGGERGAWRVCGPGPLWVSVGRAGVPVGGWARREGPGAARPLRRLRGVSFTFESCTSAQLPRGRQTRQGRELRMARGVRCPPSRAQAVQGTGQVPPPTPGVTPVPLSPRRAQAMQGPWRTAPQQQGCAPSLGIGVVGSRLLAAEWAGLAPGNSQDC